MTLTQANMETRDGLLSHSIYRDIARMDEEQLNKYVRDAFMGVRDTQFLPEPFWNWFVSFDYELIIKKRAYNPCSPAKFFSFFHNTCEDTATGSVHIGYKDDPQPYFEYRQRYRKVLNGIFNDCIQGEGTMSEEEKALAAYACEAVGAIHSPASFIEKILTAQAYVGKEGSSYSVSDTEQIQDEIESFPGEYQTLQGKRDYLIQATDIPIFT